MMKQNSMPKQAVHPQKQQPGCIWGLFRIFDFRQGYSTQRLLSDRRDGDVSVSVDTKHSRKRLTRSSRRRKESCSSVDDVVEATMLDEPRSSSATTGQMLMKTLIANEIINDTHGDCFSPSKRSQSKVHQKQKFKTAKVVHNLQSGYAGASRSEKSNGIFLSNPMERHSESIDQRTSLERFYIWYACQVSELEKTKVSDSSHDMKGKGDETQSFVYNKSYETGDIVDDESHCLKEFMDSLEILDSKKELFVKLLQDRNSILAKHIQGLRDDEVAQMSQAKSNRSSERPELSEDNREIELSKQNLHRHSRMRHKLWGQGSFLRSSDMSQNSTKIVILKPGTPCISDDMSLTSSSSFMRSLQSVENQEREKLSSPFSLKQIKRKVRLAISDPKVERHCESMDGVLHRIPDGSQSSEIRESLCGRHVKVEPSKRQNRASGSESWRQKNWRPLRPHRIIVDELSTRGYSFPENKNVLCSRSLTQPRETVATREGRRHICEILSARGAVEPLLTKPSSRTLGRVLSLPDLILLPPRLSPPRDLCEETQTSHNEQPSLEISSHTGGHDPIYRVSQMQDLVLEYPIREVNEAAEGAGVDGASMGFQDMNCTDMDGVQDDIMTELVTCTGVQESGGDEEEIKSMNTGEEEIEQLIIADYPPNIVEDTSRALPDLCFCSSPAGMENSTNTKCLILDPITDIRSPVSPSSELSEQSVLSRKVYEDPHEPSPVSVLEPAFTEDLSSSDIDFPDQQEAHLVNPRKIDFEEAEDSRVLDNLPTSRSTVSNESKLASKMYAEENAVDFEYVKSLLEASNFTDSKDFFASIDTSDQPLHQTLFLLIDPPGEVSVDQLLLFDVVNEVLLDISNKHTAYHSAVLPSIPTIAFPTGQRLLEEVWEGTKWHLSMHSQASRILEDIVASDLAKNSRWMDLTCSAESIGIDVEVSLLEDLIEETATELAN